MKFERHIERALQVTVHLINALTPGQSGGRDVPPVPCDQLASTITPYLSSDQGPVPCTQADAARLLHYATAARTVIEAIDTGHLTSAADTVNSLLRETGARPQLDRHPTGWHLHFHGTDDTVGTGWAAGGAAALALIIGSDRPERLGICGATDCDRVYLDQSKNGSRAFCSGACQSRVKAAAHRLRRKGPPRTR